MATIKKFFSRHPMLPLIIPAGLLIYFVYVALGWNLWVSVSDWEQYSLEASYPWEYTRFPATHTKESNDVYVRIQNDGPDTLWDPYAYLIARDEKGSPVYVDVTIAYRVGIPAGQALEFPTFLTPDLERFLVGNGLAPVDFTVGGYIY